MLDIPTGNSLLHALAKADGELLLPKFVSVEEQAAVPVAALRVSPDKYVFLPMTADQLKAAPKLQRGTADWWTNENFRAQNDQYYAQLN